MDMAVTRSSRFLALAGLAGIIFGVVVLVWPGLSLTALIALFGAFALVYGAFLLASGLNLLAHKSTEWVPNVLGGLAGIAIGAVAFLRPGITVYALLYVIAGWAVITGVFEIVAAIDLRGMAQGSWLLGISGVLSIVFGALIAIWPSSGALAILWLIGIYSIIGGIMRIGFAYRVHTAQGAARDAVRELGVQT